MYGTRPRLSITPLSISISFSLPSSVIPLLYLTNHSDQSRVSRNDRARSLLCGERDNRCYSTSSSLLSSPLFSLFLLYSSNGFSLMDQVFESASPYQDHSLPLRRPTTLPTDSSIDSFELGGFRGSGSSSIFKESSSLKSRNGTHHHSSRPILPYSTHYSDSGFGSALSSGSSCSYLPPPPPYRCLRPSKHSHRIHRSFSDSKYTGNAGGIHLPSTSVFPSMDSRQMRGLSWNSRISLSPSPSMSSVSCPEYPELQDKLQRLAMARDSLTLQVSVLSEQVSAQKEKIGDLESLLTQRRGGDDMHSERLSHADEVDARQLDIMAEVSNLKMKFAVMEREKNEAEKKLHLSQSEMDHLHQSMVGMSHRPMHMQPHVAIQRQNEEVEQLRDAVHRLIADNEAKNAQISHLRSALEAQQRESYTVYSQTPRYQNAQNDGYDFNAQLRKLLLDESAESMAHSSSFPLSLCSSNPAPPSSRSAVQSSSSFNSSLSAASPPSSWCHTPTQRGPNPPHLNPNMQSYRSPSSPAARQLAAELDELRRIGPNNVERGPHTYSTASLPRSSFNKTQSTLTLPGKKLSVASSSVESDDEITRGRLTAATSTLSVKQPNLRRDRTRSSLRNLFSKFARSNSQDQGGTAFRRGSTARSTSSARLGSSTNGPISGPIAMRPPVEHFLEWKGEQLAEWMAEIGYAYLAPTVAAMVRSGRQFIHMRDSELERELGIKNPLHRKRILLILEKIGKNTKEVIDKWDLHQVVRWLEEIGLPQYKEVFTEFIIDGPMLLSLTASDMVEMRITSALHYATIARSIDRLRKSDCKMNGLVRKFDPAILSTYPCPEVVSRWSQQATCEWLQTIDLAEFTPNLLCAGVPGALMVYDPSFTAETLAEIMQMPAHKTLLRRHLSTHFNQLIGQKIVSAKRDFLAQGHWPQMSPNLKIKVVRKGFSLTRKRAKGEICVEPDELLHHSLPASVTVENGTEVTSNI